jgi:uncharacterized protein
MKRAAMFRSAAWLVAALVWPLGAEEAKVPKVLGGAAVQEVYRVRLDKNDLLLESLMDAIKSNGIRDGAVLTAAGSLSRCTFHGVNSTMTTVTEPMELSSLGGLIADGQPHLHVVLTSKARGAFGGHLENGCEVLSHAEITILKFSGAPLARKAAGSDGGVLQPK